MAPEGLHVCHPSPMSKHRRYQTLSPRNSLLGQIFLRKQQHELKSFSLRLWHDGHRAQSHPGAYEPTDLTPVLCLYLHQCLCVHVKA